MIEEDWRLFFIDQDGQELISTYSWSRPEDANLFVSRFRSDPSSYNFIDPDGKIVTGEKIDFSADIFVRLVNANALLSSGDQES